MTSLSTELSTSWLWRCWFPSEGSPRLSMPARLSLKLGAWLLSPLGVLGASLGRIRLRQQMRAPRVRLPVIAVGNWIVGGAGKTPACMALAQALSERGYTPAILSRGFGGKIHSTDAPLVMDPRRLSMVSPSMSGDEPWLLAWRTGCPVAVHPNRLRAAQAIMTTFPAVDVLLLDDGLSQTTLQPSLRVLVLDDRLLGNGLCLPAGPLRHAWPPPSAYSIDAVLARSATDVSGLWPTTPTPRLGQLTLRPDSWVRPIARGGAAVQAEQCSLADMQTGTSPWALCGIARPAAFVSTLASLGIRPTTCLALKDHAELPRQAFLKVLSLAHRRRMTGPSVLLMTEKDAVKFGHSPTEALCPWWALRLDATLDPEWTDALLQKLKKAYG